MYQKPLDFIFINYKFKKNAIAKVREEIFVLMFSMKQDNKI